MRPKDKFNEDRVEKYSLRIFKKGRLGFPDKNELVSLNNGHTTCQALCIGNFSDNSKHRYSKFIARSNLGIDEYIIYDWDVEFNITDPINKFGDSLITILKSTKTTHVRARSLYYNRYNKSLGELGI